jgi:hypothetical protein
MSPVLTLVHLGKMQTLKYFDNKTQGREVSVVTSIGTSLIQKIFLVF